MTTALDKWGDEFVPIGDRTPKVVMRIAVVVMTEHTGYGTEIQRAPDTGGDAPDTGAAASAAFLPPGVLIFRDDSFNSMATRYWYRARHTSTYEDNSAWTGWVGAFPVEFDEATDKYSFDRPQVALGLETSQQLRTIMSEDGLVEADIEGDMLLGTLGAAVQISSGSAVNRSYIKALAANPDTADSLVDGSVQRVTTLNETTGAAQGYLGLDGSGIVKLDVPLVRAAANMSGINTSTGKVDGTFETTALISSGEAVNRTYVKATAGTANDADAITDSATVRVVTLNEGSGAASGYAGLTGAGVVKLDVPLTNVVSNVPALSAAGAVNRAAVFSDGDYAVAASASDGGTIDAAVDISTGDPVNRAYVKATSVTVNTASGIIDGTTDRVVTLNEGVGATRAYSGLDASFKVTQDVPLALVVAEVPALSAAGAVNRTAVFSDGDYAVVSSASDGGTIDAAVDISTGDPVNRAYVKATSVTPNTASGIIDGTTDRVVTLNEGTGATRAYSGLDASFKVTQDVPLALAVAEIPALDASGDVIRANAFDDGSYAVRANVSTGLTINSGVKISTGVNVNRAYVKATSGTADTADGIVDGSTQAVTTLNEITGAARAYSGTDGSGHWSGDVASGVFNAAQCVFDGQIRMTNDTTFDFRNNADSSWLQAFRISTLDHLFIGVGIPQGVTSYYKHYFRDGQGIMLDGYNEAGAFGSTGKIRVKNNTSNIIMGRNAGDTFDHTILEYTDSTHIRLGGLIIEMDGLADVSLGSGTDLILDGGSHIDMDTTNPASTGNFRLSYGQNMFMRNLANSSNLPVIELGDDSNELKFGNNIGTDLYNWVEILGSSELRSAKFVAFDSGVPATAGAFRLGSTEGLQWRNNADSANLIGLEKDSSDVFHSHADRIQVLGTGAAKLMSGSAVVEWDYTGLGFNAATPIAKPTITGSRGGNAALADLLTKLASYGLITDSTS